MKYDSREYYNRLIKPKQISTIIAIEKTKKYIDRHYKLELDSDYLLERYKLLNFYITQEKQSIVSAFIGVVTGVLASLFYAFIDNELELFNNVLLKSILLIILGLSIGFIISKIPTHVKGVFNSTYYNFIVPYEKNVIIQKLKTDYHFDCNCNIKVLVRKRKNMNT